jgi:hypothetical protein
MGWGRKRRKVRKATLSSDMDYVHPLLGSFYLPAGTEVILVRHEKVIDRLVLNAYNMLKRIGTSPVIFEHDGRYYVASESNLREGSSYAPRGNKFRRNR